MALRIFQKFCTQPQVFPSPSILKKDYDLITQQIQKLSAEGHDVQLHIHPHWEDSTFDGIEWIFDTNRYKLSDFSKSISSTSLSLAL